MNIVETELLRDLYDNIVHDNEIGNLCIDYMYVSGAVYGGDKCYFSKQDPFAVYLSNVYDRNAPIWDYVVVE